MRKTCFFMSVLFLSCFFPSCDSEASNTGTVDNSVCKEVDNLLEKNGLSLSAYIWNDYMPGTGPSERPSYCSITFDSTTKLPPMEVSATIITERITIPDIGFFDEGNEPNGLYFCKHFRPVHGFRLNDREEYTIKITVKISGEQQTITIENEQVDVTS